MRLLIASTLFAVLMSGLDAFAQEDEKKEELIAYSLVEVKNLMDNFKSTYKKTKTPEEDAISCIDGMKDAYRYFESKGQQVVMSGWPGRGTLPHCPA